MTNPGVPRRAAGPSRRDTLRFSAGIGLGMSTSVLPAAAAAATGGATGAPEGSTLVTWSSGEQFDAWSSPTTTESDQPTTDGNVWQLFQAHQAIENTSGTADGLGIATTANAPHGFDDFFWYAAVSGADDTIGSINNIRSLANVFGPDYTAGGLLTSDPTATVTIPAGRYFVIGQNEGPTYRAVRTLAASRTAVSGGVAQFTAVNRV